MDASVGDGETETHKYDTWLSSCYKGNKSREHYGEDLDDTAARQRLKGIREQEVSTEE